jgi:hypothetical protein
LSATGTRVNDVAFLPFSGYVSYMSIRIRAIIAIVLSNFLIILFSVSAGITYVRKNVEKAQETDLMVISDIADKFVSSQIELIKLRAASVVQTVTSYPEREWQEKLEEQESLYQEFTGMSVLDSGGRLIAAAGKQPAPADVIDDVYIMQAFQGKRGFSSTMPHDDGMVFYLAGPHAKRQNTGFYIAGEFFKPDGFRFHNLENRPYFY